MAAASQVFAGEDFMRGVELVGFDLRKVGEFGLQGIARPVMLCEAVLDGPG